MIWGEWISNLNISLRCLWLWQAVQCAKRDFSSFDDLLADAAWFHVAMRYTGTRLCFRHHIIITSVSRTELNLWLSSYVWTPTSLPPPPAVYYSQTSQQLLPATTNKRYFAIKSGLNSQDLSSAFLYNCTTINSWQLSKNKTTDSQSSFHPPSSPC